MTVDKGILQLCAFAKYAVAFPKMSRSIFTRANSARNRLIAICSAPSDLAAAAMLCPQSPAAQLPA